jgi:WD40 repeat protein
LHPSATGKLLGPPLFQPGLVQALACSPDGTRVVTTGQDGTARLWQAPVPLSPEVERLRLWVQVATGMDLDASGIPRELDAAAWRQRWLRLQELGGPPLP